MTSNSPAGSDGDVGSTGSSAFDGIDLEPARDQITAARHAIADAYRRNPKLVIAAAIGSVVVLSALIRAVSSK